MAFPDELRACKRVLWPHDICTEVCERLDAELSKVAEEARLAVLEKIEDLSAEFEGNGAAECLVIIGGYVGESLHAIRAIQKEKIK